MIALLLSTAAYGEDAGGGPEPVSVPELDSAIDDVITQPEYAWRLARQRDPDAKKTFWGAFFESVYEWTKGVLQPIWRPVKKFLKWIAEMAKKFARWLDRMFSRDPSAARTSLDWQNWVRVLLFVVLATALSFLAILLLRIWRNRTRRPATVSAFARPTASDILEEKVAADELPMDEWMALAREFLENGELRLAVRAMFLGCLVYLANREKLTIARYKSNREYIRELNRRAHDVPDVLIAFSENVGILERLWYGMHKATEEIVKAFTDNQERIFGTRPPRPAPPLSPLKAGD